MEHARYLPLFVAEARARIARIAERLEEGGEGGVPPPGGTGSSTARASRRRRDADPEVLRAAHTLVGMSATMRLDALHAAACALEDTCTRWVATPTREGAAGVVAALDGLRRQVDALGVDVAPVGPLPFDTVAEPLRTLVAATAHALGCDASVEIEGGAVRVDAARLGALQGALVHLVRNAVAHGVAPSGRPGHIRLVADRSEGPLVVDVGDDGVGLDTTALRAAAGSTHGDPTDLAFAPGVSTRVGPASGRGQGLAAAAAIVAALGGTLTLSARPEGGVRARIVLPA